MSRFFVNIDELYTSVKNNKIKNGILDIDPYHFKYKTREFSGAHFNVDSALANLLYKICRGLSTSIKYRSYTYIDDMISEANIKLLRKWHYADLKKKPKQIFNIYYTIVDNVYKDFISSEKKYNIMKNEIKFLNGMPTSYSFEDYINDT